MNPLADHYRAVRARMGMAPPRPVVSPRIVKRPMVVVATPAPPKKLTQKPQPLWRGQISAVQVQFVVAEYFNVTRDSLVSPSRKHSYALPRHIAMYLSRKLTKLSLPQIGAQFQRDHTTVLHATRVVEKLMATRQEVAEQVGEMETILTGHWPFTYWGC